MENVTLYFTKSKRGKEGKSEKREKKVSCPDNSGKVETRIEDSMI